MLTQRSFIWRFRGTSMSDSSLFFFFIYLLCTHVMRQNFFFQGGIDRISLYESWLTDPLRSFVMNMCYSHIFSFMLTPFPFVSNPVIFGPRKWEFVSLCTEDCLKGWNHFSNPWCGITFPTPGVGNTFPSLGRKQYQSDSTPGMEKLLHFSILSPQISILPWLGLHKAWNL